MGKQYFTIYLPTKGEIKGGDWYEDLLPTPDKYVKCTSDEEAKLLNESGHKKVALFLCSRDIPVGDEMVVLRDNLWGEAGQTCKLIKNSRYRAKCTVLGANGNYYDAECDIEDSVERGNVAKKIGKVSPDATWVKEGMEFDEDDWMLYTLGGYNQPIFVTKDHANGKLYVAFRCPSSPNHFH